jgi:hypothetical protein
MDLPPDDREGLFIRRVARTAWGLVIVGAAGELILRKSFAGAASLTGAGAVAIINFRWLEAVLRRVVQPGQPRFDRRSLLRIVGRLALFAGLFAALLWVPQVEPVAVVLGFSALVVALIVEGLRWGRSGGG